MKVIKPFIERIHPVGDGIQKLYRFKNNWGASVVRYYIRTRSFLRPTKNGYEYASYTRNEKEWELAVIKWECKGENDLKLNYDNEVAKSGVNGVIGYLTDDKVEKLLIKIKNFKS